MNTLKDKSLRELLMQTMSYTTLVFFIAFIGINVIDPTLFPKEGWMLTEKLNEVDKMTCTQLANFLIQNDYEKNNQYDKVYQHAQIIYDKEKCFQ